MKGLRTIICRIIVLMVSGLNWSSWSYRLFPRERHARENARRIWEQIQITTYKCHQSTSQLPAELCYATLQQWEISECFCCSSHPSLRVDYFSASASLTISFQFQGKEMTLGCFFVLLFWRKKKGRWNSCTSLAWSVHKVYVSVYYVCIKNIYQMICHLSGIT